LSLAAVGVLLFGLRDIATSRRTGTLAAPAPVPLGAVLSGRRHVLVTGGTGFIGTRLVEALAAGGHEVTVLTRSLGHAAHLRTPVRLVTALDQVDAARIDAVVDLAGEPVAGGLWTRRRRRNVIASRMRSLRAVARLIRRLEERPKVLIKASAVGWYGLNGDEMLTEADGAGDRRHFSVRSTALCEAAARRAGEALGVRVVNLRVGLVLGRDGGLLGRLLPVFDLGLGGRVGDGRQWMSWIGLDDMVRLIAFAIGNEDLDGAVNATAPVPVRNAEFAAALGRALGRPAVLPLPAWPLELALGDLARELLLGGQRVLPAKAVAAGFRFTSPDLATLLKVALRGEASSHLEPRGAPRSGEAGLAAARWDEAGAASGEAGPRM
jgi:uncharacterized protein (TIGR01777 family)